MHTTTEDAAIFAALIKGELDPPSWWQRGPHQKLERDRVFGACTAQR